MSATRKQQEYLRCSFKQTVITNRFLKIFPKHPNEMRKMFKNNRNCGKKELILMCNAIGIQLVQDDAKGICAKFQNRIVPINTLYHQENLAFAVEMIKKSIAKQIISLDQFRSSYDACLEYEGFTRIKLTKVNVDKAFTLIESIENSRLLPTTYNFLQALFLALMLKYCKNVNLAFWDKFYDIEG